MVRADFIQLIQFAVSLIAIFAVAHFVRTLGLGGDIRLKDETQVRKIAHDAYYGFEASDIIIDLAGISAIVKDAQNRHMLIFRNGVHFTARMLHLPIAGRLDHKFLTIELNEPGIAPITLNLGSAAGRWVSGLRLIPHG
jgi:hypothetical protein